MFKFIHAADLHIDSPLRGLEAYEGAPADQLRGATREAFSNVVTLALEEAVDFLVVAGDLFDGKWPDMRTGLWTASQFRRLDREGIPVYLVRGNHDAESRVRKSISWPENVHEFSVRKPETLRIEALGVALHGQGFAKQECKDDLAANYPAAVKDCFNIGVLHTSLTGSTEHDTYAPTREDVLVGRGYDYWALGHVHQRSMPPIRRDPYIAFCGNAQGRHVRETGEKGCLLVTIEDGGIANADFRATDVARWHLAEVMLESSDTVSDALAKANDCLIACHDSSDSRLCAVRLVLQGACAAHRSLISKTERQEFLSELRNQANNLHDEVWLEKVVVDTSLPVDWDALRQGSDLLGDLLRDVEAIDADPEQLSHLGSDLSPLVDKAGLELADAGVKIDKADQLRRWLRQAKTLLVGQLREGGQ